MDEPYHRINILWKSLNFQLWLQGAQIAAHLPSIQPGLHVLDGVLRQG